MTLKETLLQMKTEKNSNVLIESMIRRANKGLIEGVTEADIRRILDEIENDETQNRNYRMSYTKTMYELAEAIENYDYLTKDSPAVVLDEAVTFIDNAGNLKTTSTEDYVKDQHEYHTETNNLEPYDKKKRKNKDYKLISENLDMSLEEILNEAIAEVDDEK